MPEYNTKQSEGRPENLSRLSNSGDLGQNSRAGMIGALAEVPYFHPVTSELHPGVVASVDMLRQEFVIRADSFEELYGKLDSVVCDDTDYWHANRVGQYQSLWAYSFGDARVSLGLGLVGAAKVDKTKGFLEFNPNKVGHVRPFYKIRDLLVSAGARFRTKRFDLALDVPRERREYQLIKDRRKYEYHNGGSVSEYLGQRNKVGRVKLYDKQAESKLEGPLTRLEITCGPDFKSAVDSWPRVVGLDSLERFTTSSRCLLKALGRLAELGEPLQPYFDMLDRKTRNRYIAEIKQDFKVFPVVLISEIYAQVEAWEKHGRLDLMHV